MIRTLLVLHYYHSITTVGEKLSGLCMHKIFIEIPLGLSGFMNDHPDWV